MLAGTLNYHGSSAIRSLCSVLADITYLLDHHDLISHYWVAWDLFSQSSHGDLSSRPWQKLWGLISCFCCDVSLERQTWVWSSAVHDRSIGKVPKVFNELVIGAERIRNDLGSEAAAVSQARTAFLVCASCTYKGTVPRVPMAEIIMNCVCYSKLLSPASEITPREALKHLHSFNQLHNWRTCYSDFEAFSRVLAQSPY